MQKFHLFSLVLYIYLLKMFLRCLFTGITYDKQTSPEKLTPLPNSGSVSSSEFSLLVNSGITSDALFLKSNSMLLCMIFCTIFLFQFSPDNAES